MSMNDHTDKFFSRPGAKLGRCNALRNDGKLCMQWPIAGHRRCRWHNGGWHKRCDHAAHMARARAGLIKEIT